MNNFLNKGIIRINRFGQVFIELKSEQKPECREWRSHNNKIGQNSANYSTFLFQLVSVTLTNTTATPETASRNPENASAKRPSAAPTTVRPAPKAITTTPTANLATASPTELCKCQVASGNPNFHNF